MYRGHSRIPARLPLFQPAGKSLRAKRPRANRAAARTQRCQHTRDEPVNVKQRHHTEASVGRLELQRRPDVPGGGEQIGVRERHHLRTGGRPRGVKHQRDIVCFSESRSGRERAGNAGQMESPHAIFSRNQLDHRHPKRIRRRPRRRVTALRKNQRPRLQILQVKQKLFSDVSRIERSRRCARGNREKGHGQIRSLR